MPTPRQTWAESVEAVETLNAALRDRHDFRAALMDAAKSLGLELETLRSRIATAERRYGLKFEVPKPAPEQAPEPEERPRVRIKATSAADELPIYKVLGIGDAHDAPSLPDKARFRWMARHAVATKPDHVVQIGDFASFDSLSRHDLPGSIGQKVRPNYNHDLESLEEALTAFYKEAAGLDLHVTLGNHEARVKRFQDASAELEGVLWEPLMDLFARYGWRTHQEGEFYFIGGVGFVHAPRTIMNREYAGKTLNPIGNDAMFSIVFGHSHRGQVLHVPKIGPLQGVTILNLGTALPTGYVADYARVAVTGWTWGVYDISIQGGRIVGHAFISMDELERRYGD